MKSKKIQSLFFVVFTIMVFSSEASAKWCVVCFGKYGCMAIHAACDDFHRPKKATCRDLPIALKLSDHLNREKDGGASFTIDGEIIPIASDACVALLLPAIQAARESERKIDDEKFQKEFETFMEKGKGPVSDIRLKQISRELGIPITDKK